MDRIRVLQADGLDASRYGGDPVTPDVPWSPGRLWDLTPYEDGYAVLDALTQELVWISGDLTAWETWATDGPGPGELAEPQALVTADAGSGDLLVLQGRPPAVHRFGGGGKFGNTFRLNSRARDIGVTADGRIWLTHDIWAAELQSRGDAQMPLLISTTDDGRETREDWSATGDSLDAPRYNVPSLVEVRIASRGRFVAVYFPLSGIIELFDDGVHARTLETCMPDELREAYRRQLRDIEGVPPPGSVEVVNFVRLLADVRVGDGGEVWALAGAPTDEGFLHIDRFDASGRNAGSILFAPGGSPWPVELRFGLDPERTIIEFDGYEGHIVIYQLSGSR
ncbi:hypothetical protein [Candidatus Palauibacter sp.]|uniref:hypothetical protein n=1 Tax=Candidatus Palauibacter sp. TaxID=3101350 RepID=UPI003B02237E